MTHTITVVGLGNYNIDDLPLGVYRFLENKTKIYARTLDHPVIEELKETLQFESFDHIYEKNSSFEEVYQTIVNELIQHAQTEDIVYAVPGHPRVAETTLSLIHI